MKRQLLLTLILLPLVTIMLFGQNPVISQASTATVYFHSTRIRNDLTLFSVSGSEIVYEQADTTQPIGPLVSATLSSLIPASRLSEIGVQLPGYQNAYIAYASWLLLTPSNTMVDGPVQINVWMSSNDDPGLGSAYFFAIADVNPQSFLDNTLQVLKYGSYGGIGNVLGNSPRAVSTNNVGEQFNINHHLFTAGRALAFFVGAGAIKSGWKFNVQFNAPNTPSGAVVPIALIPSSISSSTTQSGSSTYSTTAVASSTTAPFTTSSNSQSTTSCALSASVTSSLSSGVAPLSVTFTAYVTGAIQPTRFDWWLGDGSHLAGTFMQTYTYPNVGLYSVYVIATDSRGCWSRSNSLSIVVSSSASTTTPSSISSSTQSAIASTPSGYKIPFQGMQLSYYSETTSTLTQRTGIEAYGSINLMFHDVSSSSSKMDIAVSGNAIMLGNQSPLNIEATVELPTDRDTLLYLRNAGVEELTIYAGQAWQIPLIPNVKLDLTRSWTLHDKAILRTDLTSQGSFNVFRYHTSLQSVPAPTGGSIDLDFYASYEASTQILVYGEVYAKQGGMSGLIEKIQLKRTNVQFQSGSPRCVIATAAFESELAAPVEFLRNFRDGEVNRTNLGHSFFTAFNAWYYSWAPSIAAAELKDSNLRGAVRLVVIPLLGSLIFAEKTYKLLHPINPEGAILTAGLMTSGLLGLVYLAPIMILVVVATRRRLRLKEMLVAAASVGVALTILGTIFHGTIGFLENVTALTVIETIVITPTLLVSFMLKGCEK